MSNPDKCQHEFVSNIAVYQLQAGDNKWGADVTITCRRCGSKAEFTGMQAGVLPGLPTVSVDAHEARIPFKLKAPFKLVGVN